MWTQCSLDITAVVLAVGGLAFLAGGAIAVVFTFAACSDERDLSDLSVRS